MSHERVTQFEAWYFVFFCDRLILTLSLVHLYARPASDKICRPLRSGLKVLSQANQSAAARWTALGRTAHE